MGKKITIQKFANSKGASIFKKMLEDKKAIHEHIQGGGRISDLKGQFNFVKFPVPSSYPYSDLILTL